VGSAVVGWVVGRRVGSAVVGWGVGRRVGRGLGRRVGRGVGRRVGSAVSGSGVESSNTNSKSTVALVEFVVFVILVGAKVVTVIANS
jgi:hypothetical protein